MSADIGSWCIPDEKTIYRKILMRTETVIVLKCLAIGVLPHGTWGGTVKIQRSFDDGTTWNDFRTYTSANDNNTSTSGEEETEDVLYRVRMEDYVQSGSGTIRLCRAKFSNPDFVVNGEVKITAVTDSTHASATVIRKAWQFGKNSRMERGCIFGSARFCADYCIL